VAVVVNSSTTADVLMRDYGVPQAKLTIALPGTDRQVFAACTGNPPVLLTIATLTRRKAHDVLIAALAQLAHLPWVARFVGGGDFDPRWAAGLRQQVAALGLQQRIEFVGSLADLRPEYAQADLFVLPTLYEGYGMVFAEALAFGLPIVATRAGAVPDVVPETAGVLVAPADVAALTAALATLLAAHTGAAQRKRLQHGAQAAALLLPSWTATVQTVADLINTVRA
jgi:glycosyltransferase involved in cell wall biosynthesis